MLPKKSRKLKKAKHLLLLFITTFSGVRVKDGKYVHSYRLGLWCARTFLQRCIGGIYSEAEDELIKLGGGEEEEGVVGESADISENQKQAGKMNLQSQNQINELLCQCAKASITGISGNINAGDYSSCWEPWAKRFRQAPINVAEIEKYHTNVFDGYSHILRQLNEIFNRDNNSETDVELLTRPVKRTKY